MNTQQKGDVLLLGILIPALLFMGVGGIVSQLMEPNPDSGEATLDILSSEERVSENVTLESSVPPQDSSEHAMTDVSDAAQQNKQVTRATYSREQPADSTPTLQNMAHTETITLAGGCFWCTEAYLQEEPGVVDVVSGYAGGEADNATYQEVSKGTTLHREAVQVTYDPTKISTEAVLDIYWSHIDPTDAGGQFADRGSQYTTAIFYQNDEQRDIALDSKQRLGASGLFEKPVVTEVLPLTTFFPAEEYHQDYYKKAAAHYKAYKAASGRAGFVEETWAKDAALLFLDDGMSATSDVWMHIDYTPQEIAALQKELSQDAYRIVAEDGTEPAYDNAYWHNKEPGIYVDVVTGDPLFSSTHKYDSGTGWPSFWKPIDNALLVYHEAHSLLLSRTEVRGPGGHLGHIFNDGPQVHGGKRYCMNSAAFLFVPKGEMLSRGYGEWLYLFGE